MKTAAIAVGLGLVLATDTVSGQARAVDDAQSGPAAVSSKPARTVLLRAGLLGAYRELYDLSIWAGGLGLSVGGEGEHHGGHANLHGLFGRTRAGLPITEIGVAGTYEMHFGGARFGVGGGVTYLGIRRATTGQHLGSIGLGPLVRLGYDFGEGHGAYVLAQYSAQAYQGPVVYGPMLWAGWRW
jgi:hypothetical protein